MVGCPLRCRARSRTTFQETGGRADGQLTVLQPGTGVGRGRTATRPVPRCWWHGCPRRGRPGSWHSPPAGRAGRAGRPRDRGRRRAPVHREDGQRAGLLVVRGGGVEQRARRRAVASSYTGDARLDPQHLAPGQCRAAWANGWKIVCRQAGPPGSVRIGAITLTSWAWQAIADPVGVPQQGDQQAADDHRVGHGVGVLDQRPAPAQSSGPRRANRVWYQTFHSSTADRQPLAVTAAGRRRGRRSRRRPR